MTEPTAASREATCSCAMRAATGVRRMQMRTPKPCDFRFRVVVADSELSVALPSTRVSLQHRAGCTARRTGSTCRPSTWPSPGCHHPARSSSSCTRAARVDTCHHMRNCPWAECSDTQGRPACRSPRARTRHRRCTRTADCNSWTNRYTSREAQARTVRSSRAVGRGTKWARRYPKPPNYPRK